MDKPTPRRRFSDTRNLLELKFLTIKGEHLDDFIRRRRSEGVGWRRISREIDDLVAMDLNPDTLAAWFRDEATA